MAELDNEEFPYNPYERPHPFLEVFCSCCLPENRTKPSYEASEIHFWGNYLENVFADEIGLDARVISDTNFHGNGFYIIHSSIDVKRVLKLKRALTKRLRKVLISTDTVRMSSDDIRKSIATADIVIVVLSSYFQFSQNCMKELSLAQQYKKFIIPVVFSLSKADNVDLKDYPHSLKSKRPIEIQSLHEDYLHLFTGEMINNLDPVFWHIRAHTRILLRALLWDLKDFDTIMLLEGDDVQRAVNWLAYAQQQNHQNECIPTALHIAFITECDDYAKLGETRNTVAGIIAGLVLILAFFPSLGSLACAAVFLNLLLIMARMKFLGITY